MVDAIIAGAGPAGAMAAIVLARAGARVVVVDRDRFPRDKLCGDTLNPGAVRLLEAYGLRGGPLDCGRMLKGMHVTGPTASVRAAYGPSSPALAITRRALDTWLIDRAVAAGARFESGVTVRAPLLDETAGAPVVRGLVLDRAGARTGHRMPAIVTIAADGRRSTLARAVGAARPSPMPRRWAYGTYASDVADVTDEGEMHIRHGWYVGVAPLPGGLVNVCVVRPGSPGRRPIDVVRDAIRREPELARRFERAAIDDDVRVLGPLSAETRGAGATGLLFAGDAAGFVDPMTGDGVHLALSGGVLAAEEALRALETGDVAGATARLARRRRSALGWKLRFNRVVRDLVDSPRAVDAASAASRVWPGLVRRAIRYAGGVH
jgi:flavin-dependent dehydrogenase